MALPLRPSLTEDNNSRDNNEEDDDEEVTPQGDPPVLSCRHADFSVHRGTNLRENDGQHDPRGRNRNSQKETTRRPNRT
jgi:hypothetical protein